MALKDDIRKFALQNAVKFKGKSNPGAIVGRLLADNPKLKSEMKELMKDIQKTVKEVNGMKLEDQEAELKKSAPGMLKKKKKEKRGLSKIPNAVKGKMVTRLAPEPSKYNHIGHALTFLINYVYAKEYNGKSILRFEDTNPELSAKEYEILKYFVQREGEVVTRDMLLDDVWGYETFPTTRTVDNYILTLRKKIEADPSKPKHLLTIHTAGYKFVK